MQKAKLWTKDFVIVSSINFLLTLVFYLLMIVIGVYAVNHYGATVSEAGLVTGIFVVGTLIGRLFTGRAIDQVGRKKTLIIGLILFTATSLLYFIDLNTGFLIFSRFVHGMMLGIASTATGTIVAQIIPPTRRGEGIGYYSMGATLATAIGPFLGLVLTQYMDIKVIFTLCFVLGLVSLLTAFTVRIPPLVIKSEEMERVKKVQLSQFIEPNAIPISIITLILACGYAGILSFINFYASELQLVEAASFFFLVYAATVLLTRPFTGRLIDIKNANYVMYPGLVLYTIGLLLLGFTTNGFMLLLSAVFVGLGFGNLQSCIQAIAIKVTPIERAGLATSTFYIFLDAGLGIGPYLLGFIIAFTSYSQLYIILAMAVFVAIGLYYVLHGKKEATL